MVRDFELIDEHLSSSIPVIMDNRGIKMTRDMGESSLIGDMIRMPLPGGGHALYPAVFAEDAMYRKRYSLFVTRGTTSNDASLLMATLDTGARGIVAGPFNKLLREVKDLPWAENRIETSEGTMYRKISHSLPAILKVIERMKKKYGEVQ